MIVTITACQRGRCTWCCGEGEVLAVEFRDGLRGSLCWADFKKALKVRAASGAPRPSQPKPADAQSTERP